MRINNLSTLPVIAGLAVFGWLSTRVDAQDVRVTGSVPASVTLVQAAEQLDGPLFTDLRSAQMKSITLHASAHTNWAATALKKLKEAKTGEEKAAATKELRDGLGKEYESSIEQYEAKIKRMEDRLAAVRKGLTRRKDAKDEMIELRLKTLLHEADGLGWHAGGLEEKESAAWFYSPVRETRILEPEAR